MTDAPATSTRPPAGSPTGPAAPAAGALVPSSEAARIRRKIEARFAEGWGSYLAVDDSWLPHLDQLDDAIAAIRPGYQLAQVKTKFGGLRYYLQDPIELPCCIAWEEQHPYPGDEDTDAEAAWSESNLVHLNSSEHLEVNASHVAAQTQIETLVDAAESASYDW